MITFADIVTYDTDPAGGIAVFAGLGFFWLAFYVLLAVALWKVFSKAGYPGWLAIIPIVNMFVLVKVAGFSAWLGLLYFIPIVNLVFAIIVAFRTGSAFGKGGVFSFFLLWMFAFVGYFIIGFDKSTYTKPV
ncbi:DUF5684 domain-containing protein [Microbacterium aquimaris]|uniref:DUF5684 domain-containing protein n=1 Tax=Microbacterium aquimaris TaxID=459816 RepID=A0ABU5N2D3_9MICO|nr:DUF5684 domain-containing protein [Microbacterium aquimaris]MDZ8160236.1 DUF5684 domain-containing protein [Microbacterium aquimaris]